MTTLAINTFFAIVAAVSLAVIFPHALKGLRYGRAIRRELGL